MSAPTVTLRRTDQGPAVDGYEYGNARLRARRSQLLSRADLRELYAAGSPERMLGVLRSTAYGPDVERALVQPDVLHRLDAAVRDHLTRSLGDLRRFYVGRAAAGVELLLGRWDLRNLIAVVRRAARPGPAPELESLVVAAGTLDAAALGELARQPSLRSTVELMVAWDLPSRATARRLLRAWPDFEATGDTRVFEEALAHAWAESVADGIADWSGTELESALRTEIDLINLLAALRSRDDGVAGVADASAGRPLPGGTLPPALLDRVLGSPAPTDVVAVLTERTLPSGWDAALERWRSDGDLGALGGRLDRALARFATGLFVHGDPLGIAIPVAYVWAKECEVRDVRLVGRALVHRLAWSEIEPELSS